MSRFMVYTDFHMTGKTPVHRTDDFPLALLAKLREVYLEADLRKVDFVLFLGDFFNNHRMYSYDIINEIIDIINGCSVNTYAIVGQHDLVGNNVESYKTSTLCFVERHCEKYRTLNAPLEMADLVLYPCHNYNSFTDALKAPITRKKKSILLAHQLITHKKCIFPTFVVSEFMPCQYSAVLFGDAHCGMSPFYDEKGTLVWSPGAMARMAYPEVDRPVKAGIVTAVLGKRVEVEEIFLKSAKPGNEIFAKSIIEQLREAPEMVDTNRFIDSIIELEASSFDIFDLIEKTAGQRSINKDVVDYIMSKRDMVTCASV